MNKGNEYQNVKELIKGLKQYFKFYNFELPHQSLEDKTPVEIYWGKDLVRMAA